MWRLLVIVLCTLSSLLFYVVDSMHAFDLHEATVILGKQLTAKRYYIDINFSSLETDILGIEEARTIVFVHATIGIFKRKRGKEGTWGHGTDILIEMLRTLELTSKPLLDSLHRVYIGALGSPEEIKAAQAQVRGNTSSKAWSDKISWVVTGEELSYSELPTLLVLQLFADAVPPGQIANSTRVLYMHTKGVRRNGKYSQHWREYMLHMLVSRYETACLPAMRDLGYKTCGALKTPTGKGPIYAGNFWWASIAYLHSLPRVVDFEWSHGNRYAAENFLLQGVTRTESRLSHYCVHHTHHDMQNCPTPSSLYTHLVLPLRASGDCFNFDLKPKNQSRAVPSSWCHSGTLPLPLLRK